MERIGEKIIYLSKHPEVIERMKGANIRKAKKLFDRHTNAAKVAAVYDSLINQRNWSAGDVIINTFEAQGEDLF